MILNRVDRKATLLTCHLSKHLTALWEQALWIPGGREILEDYRNGKEASVTRAERMMGRAEP